MAWSSAAEQTSLFQIAELIISTQRVLLSIFPLIIEQATQQQEAKYGKMAFKGANTLLASIKSFESKKNLSSVPKFCCAL